MVRLALVVILVLGVEKMDASSETMKSITTSFLKVLEDCKHEINLPDNILIDLYHFWKDDQALLARDVGCAIVCMSKKLNLLDDSGKLHHGNAAEFAEQHGADVETGRKLITVVHECEKQHEEVNDDCLRALEVAKCFRATMRELHWAPKLDVVVKEIVTEV